MGHDVHYWVMKPAAVAQIEILANECLYSNFGTFIVGGIILLVRDSNLLVSDCSEDPRLVANFTYHPGERNCPTYTVGSGHVLVEADCR